MVGLISIMSSAIVRKLRMKPVLAPTLIGRMKLPMNENAWKSGSTLRKISLSNIGTRFKVCAALAMNERWVSMAPLGRPVVPLV